MTLVSTIRAARARGARLRTGVLAALASAAVAHAQAPAGAPDLVVFDAAKVSSSASYEDPGRYAEGIVHVMVNGKFAVRDGKPTHTLAGRALRRQAQ